MKSLEYFGPIGSILTSAVCAHNYQMGGGSWYLTGAILFCFLATNPYHKTLIATATALSWFITYSIQPLAYWSDFDIGHMSIFSITGWIGGLALALYATALSSPTEEFKFVIASSKSKDQDLQKAA